MILCQNTVHLEKSHRNSAFFTGIIFQMAREPYYDKPCRNGSNCRDQPHCRFQHQPSQAQCDIQVGPCFDLQIVIFNHLIPVQVFQPTWRLRETRLFILPPGQISSSSRWKTSSRQTSKKQIKVLKRKQPEFSVLPPGGQITSRSSCIKQFRSVQKKYIKIFKRK